MKFTAAFIVAPLTLLASTLFLTPSAYADDPQELMSEYNHWNVVTFNDAELNAESEGAVAVGGTLRFSHGTQTTLHSNTNTSHGISLLTQRLDLKSSQGTLQALNGEVRVGDVESADVLNRDSNGANVHVRVVAKGAGYDSTPNISTANQNNADTVHSPELFKTLFNKSRAISLANKISAGATVDPKGVEARVELSNWGTATVHLQRGQRNYWKIDAQDLAKVREIKFEGSSPNANEGTYLITSISGKSVTFNTNTCGNRDPKAMLWVAADASHMSQIGDSIDGSILAPNAHLDKQSANIQGTIVVDSGNFNGSEQHYYPFRSATPHFVEEPEDPQSEEAEKEEDNDNEGNEEPNESQDEPMKEEEPQKNEPEEPVSEEPSESSHPHERPNPGNPSSEEPEDDLVESEDPKSEEPQDPVESLVEDPGSEESDEPSDEPTEPEDSEEPTEPSDPKDEEPVEDPEDENPDEEPQHEEDEEPEDITEPKNDDPKDSEKSEESEETTQTNKNELAHTGSNIIMLAVLTSLAALAGVVMRAKVRSAHRK
ncbi:collagen-binding domain-containing protein [Alloscardovia omnicolens]|uniref:collagen-binding domain-containing protein n=1 Tax=Alloscardovia omnicolens TaxID=419015 RepID=UPI003A6F6F3E